jgi:hypothetical protein
MEDFRRRTMNMLSSPKLVAALCGAMIFFAGCSKNADINTNYTRAINDYYSTHPACLWSEPVKFPVQVDTSDNSKTAGYDALVDQGLLERTTAEKNKLIVISKQVNNYDLSDKGRTAWIADSEQPGYGNFCYGHKKVQAIDSSTPASSDEGSVTQVNYHTTLGDAPSWAKAAETQNAYPRLRTELSSSQPAEATLINTHNGWQVGRMQPSRS